MDFARHNRLRRLAKRRLTKIGANEKDSFDRWWSLVKASKHSQQEDFPSSRIVPKRMLVSAELAQLFVVVDTCSIVKHRCGLIDYVLRLKELFPRQACPVRLIVSLVVLEELDKCNRAPKKKVPPAGLTGGAPGGAKASGQVKQEGQREFTPTGGQQQDRGPPRMFMRFIEEEMRSSEVLISELDPFKRTKLGERGQRLEIVTPDDRILECCLRTQTYLESQAHHPESKVILVTEDNIFKSKATTFGVVSYRWAEFEAKFKNYGLQHYVSTPLAGHTFGRRLGLSADATAQTTAGNVVVTAASIIPTSNTAKTTTVSKMANLIRRKAKVRPVFRCSLNAPMSTRQPQSDSISSSYFNLSTSSACESSPNSFAFTGISSEKARAANLRALHSNIERFTGKRDSASSQNESSVDGALQLEDSVIIVKELININ